MGSLQRAIVEIREVACQVEGPDWYCPAGRRNRLYLAELMTDKVEPLSKLTIHRSGAREMGDTDCSAVSVCGNYSASSSRLRMTFPQVSSQSTPAPAEPCDSLLALLNNPCARISLQIPGTDRAAIGRSSEFEVHQSLRACRW